MARGGAWVLLLVGKTMTEIWVLDIQFGYLGEERLGDELARHVRATHLAKRCALGKPRQLWTAAELQPVSSVGMTTDAKSLRQMVTKDPAHSGS